MYRYVTREIVKLLIDLDSTGTWPVVFVMKNTRHMQCTLHVHSLINNLYEHTQKKSCQLTNLVYYHLISGEIHSFGRSLIANTIIWPVRQIQLFGYQRKRINLM